MGLSDRDDGNAPNALKVVLDLLGEPLPCAAYDGWTCYFPEGQFNVKVRACAPRRVFLLAMSFGRHILLLRIDSQ